MARLTRRVNRQPFKGHSERWHTERQARVRARRDPVILAMYSTPQWRTLRALVLRDANYICASYRCPNRARIADHIKPHRGDAGAFFDRANLQALCKRCHDKKTARLDGGFGNPLRESYARSPHTGHASAAGNPSGGGLNQGGESRFSGGFHAARLLSRLRMQPNGKNEDAEKKRSRGGTAPNPSDDHGQRVPSLRAGLTRALSAAVAPVDTGVGAPNHLPAPVRPAIRNKLVRG